MCNFTSQANVCVLRPVMFNEACDPYCSSLYFLPWLTLRSSSLLFTLHQGQGREAAARNCQTVSTFLLKLCQNNPSAPYATPLRGPNTVYGGHFHANITVSQRRSPSSHRSSSPKLMMREFSSASVNLENGWKSEKKPQKLFGRLVS